MTERGEKDVPGNGRDTYWYEKCAVEMGRRSHCG